MDLKTKIYQNLPHSAKTIAASLRGYQLRRWRYDKETEKLVEQALERDYWSPEQWKNWQEEKLAFLLHRAATKVPFYREQWAERRRKGDKSSWEYLENWKILEKKTLKERPTDFVADDCNRSKMFRDNTSGTTGTSLYIWLSKDAVKNWYALFEARCRRWYGVAKQDRWAHIGGQVIIPFNQTTPPFWVWNAGLKQLYMSTYHTSPQQIKYYPEALVKYKIEYILGYPSAIYFLALEVLNSNYKNLKMKVVITNAEPLFDYQRKIIGKAFNCPVRETYGMGEAVAGASECEKNCLHLWQDAGKVEVIGEDNNIPGDLICTGLVNMDMPLIRYRVGDYGQLSREKCACGKTLPLVNSLDGRSDDLFYTFDGRRVSNLFLAQKGDLNIIESQFIQESLNKIKVKYVPAENFSQDSIKKLTQNICNRMGEVEIIFEQVKQIPRTNRGKFRAVICNLPIEERLKV